MMLFFSSFFLDPSTVGQSKAKHAMRLLQELNPDVNGDYIDENIEVIIDNNPGNFSKLQATEKKNEIDSHFRFLQNIQRNRRMLSK